MLFFQEASALATLKHPNIVNVLSFFRANGTVYMVMEYQDGKNLQAYLTARSGNLSEKFLRTVFPQLLDGLTLIHSCDLLHLDIKPGNIHIRPAAIPCFWISAPCMASRKVGNRNPGRSSARFLTDRTI